MKLCEVRTKKTANKLMTYSRRLKKLEDEAHAFVLKINQTNFQTPNSQNLKDLAELILRRLK
jgi:hypothetical protein